MERREFLKIALGFTAAAGSIAATAAQAAPLLPQTGDVLPPNHPAKLGDAAVQGEDAKPEHAIATQDDLDSIGPEQVQWRRRRWRRRYWRPRYWRPRPRPRYWRRRYWRPRRRAIYY